MNISDIKFNSLKDFEDFLNMLIKYAFYCGLVNSDDFFEVNPKFFDESTSDTDSSKMFENYVSEWTEDIFQTCLYNYFKNK